MKKYILLFLSFFIMMTVKAEGDIPIIDNYVDGHAYSEGELITNSWGYDLATDKYVKINDEGIVTLTVNDPTDEPDTKKGRLTIKANVPNSFSEKSLKVRIYSYPYSYNFTLDKTNNFTFSKQVIVGDYEITSISVDESSDFPIKYNEDFSIKENETNEITLDYSSYNQEDKEKEKDEKLKQEKLLTYGIIAIVVVVLLIALAIFGIKALHASNLY